jgi:hypothetical protein
MDDLHRLSASIHAERRDLLAVEAQSESRIAHLTSHEWSAQPDKVAAALAEEHEKLAEVRAQIVRLNELGEVRDARWQTIGRLVARLERWLRDLPADVVIAAHGPWDRHGGATPRLGKGKAAADAVERVRREVRRLLAELHAVKSAPFTSAEAKALAREQIERLAERGSPDFAELIEIGGEIGWPRTRLENAVVATAKGDGGAVSVFVPDVLALVAWLHRDALVTAVEREISDAADDEHALTATQRAERVAQIERDLFAFEFEECRQIEAAAEAGSLILPRADVDPRALLGLSPDVPAPTRF